MAGENQVVVIVVLRFNRCSKLNAIRRIRPPRGEQCLELGSYLIAACIQLLAAPGKDPIEKAQSAGYWAQRNTTGKPVLAVLADCLARKDRLLSTPRIGANDDSVHATNRTAKVTEVIRPTA